MAIKKTRNDDILDRIIEKMNEQHVTQTQLANRLGLNRCVFNTWKSNRSRTYLKYIDQIAEYLGVPYDYLLTGSSIQDVVALTSAEIPWSTTGIWEIPSPADLRITQRPFRY